MTVTPMAIGGTEQPLHQDAGKHMFDFRPLGLEVGPRSHTHTQQTQHHMPAHAR